MQTFRVILAVAVLITAATLIPAQDKEPAAPAHPNAPAEFNITTTKQHDNPGAFTATIGSVPNRALTAGGFEPMIFRTKVQAEYDSPDEIPMSFTPWDFYGAYKDGFFDGARVRVFRPRDGKFVKIRDDEVADGGYTSSGWLPFYVGGKNGDKVAAPNATKMQVTLGGSWRKNTTYWFALKTVDQNNVESEPSNAAIVMFNDTAKGAKTSGKNIIKFKQPDDLVAAQNNPPAGRPAAPRNLKASIDDKGIITFEWDGVEAANLSGYRLYYSDSDPRTHKGFHCRLTGGDSDPAKAIKNGDLIFVSQKHYTDSRNEMIHSSRFGIKGISERSNASPLGFPTVRQYPDEHPGMSWKLIKHDMSSLPEDFKSPGETCMEIELDDTATADVYCFGYGGMESTWWRPIIPGLEYTVEVWLKSDNNGTAEMQFRGFHEDLSGIKFDIGPEWKKYTATFKTDREYNGNQIGGAKLVFSGQGTHHIDNLFIYPTKDGFLEPSQMMIDRTKESGLEAIRYHNHIKSGKSYDMAMLTNGNGVVGTRGNSQPNNRNTLEALLRFTKNAGSNPWFQIEMHMSEEEWLGFMEYIAAPYDPAKDTPDSKPWAYKRYRQGQKKPWADEFDRIYFEISNETWNWMFAPWVFYPGTSDEVTGEAYDRGALYGMLNEYVLSVLKTSPYWTPEFAGKFRSVLGGWKTMDNSYTLEAVTHSANADYITVAGYNGGWDAGEDPVEPTYKGVYSPLMFWPRNMQESINNMNLLNRLKTEGEVSEKTKFGTYEAGPGYALPGNLKGQNLENQDRVGKSLANGVATLDAFLGRAADGWAIHNFFTMSFGRRNWTSHAAPVKGGHPYPSWAALSLYNNEGTGDFLLVESKSMPTNNFTYTPKKAKKPETYESIPQVASYVTADGNRLNVFVLSRKMPGIMDDNGDGQINAQDDGYSDVTLNLPVSKADNVTLYKMTGDPLAHNLDEENIKVEKVANIPFNPSFKMTRATTKEAKDGIPPSSAFLYVFEGTDMPKLNRRPEADFTLPETIVIGEAFKATAKLSDPDGDEMDIKWTIDEKTQLAGEEPSITLSEPGDHKIVMNVYDGKGGHARVAMMAKALTAWDNHLLDMRYLAASWDNHKPELKVTDTGALQFESPGRLEQHGSFAVASLNGQQSGDKSLKVHVVSRESKGDKELSKSGIIMLSSLDNGSPRVVLALSQTGQAQLLTRKAELRGSIPMTAPCWLRLDRKGSQFTAYASKDGSSWQEVGSVEENVSDSYNMGLFGAYGYYGGPETIVVDKIEVE